MDEDFRLNVRTSADVTGLDALSAAQQKAAAAAKQMESAQAKATDTTTQAVAKAEALARAEADVAKAREAAAQAGRQAEAAHAQRIASEAQLVEKLKEQEAALKRLEATKRNTSGPDSADSGGTLKDFNKQIRQERKAPKVVDFLLGASPEQLATMGVTGFIQSITQAVGPAIAGIVGIGAAFKGAQVAMEGWQDRWPKLKEEMEGLGEAINGRLQDAMIAVFGDGSVFRAGIRVATEMLGGETEQVRNLHRALEGFVPLSEKAADSQERLARAIKQVDFEAALKKEMLKGINEVNKARLDAHIEDLQAQSDEFTKTSGIAPGSGVFPGAPMPTVAGGLPLTYATPGTMPGVATAPVALPLTYASPGTPQGGVPAIVGGGVSPLVQAVPGAPTASVAPGLGRPLTPAETQAIEAQHEKLIQRALIDQRLTEAKRDREAVERAEATRLAEEALKAAEGQAKADRDQLEFHLKRAKALNELAARENALSIARGKVQQQADNALFLGGGALRQFNGGEYESTQQKRQKEFLETRVREKAAEIERLYGGSKEGDDKKEADILQELHKKQQPNAQAVELKKAELATAIDTQKEKDAAAKAKAEREDKASGYTDYRKSEDDKRKKQLERDFSRTALAEQGLKATRDENPRLPGEDIETFMKRARGVEMREAQMRLSRAKMLDAKDERDASGRVQGDQTAADRRAKEAYYKDVRGTSQREVLEQEENRKKRILDDEADRKKRILAREQYRKDLILDPKNAVNPDAQPPAVAAPAQASGKGAAKATVPAAGGSPPGQYQPVLEQIRDRVGNGGGAGNGQAGGQGNAGAGATPEHHANFVHGHVGTHDPKGLNRQAGREMGEAMAEPVAEAVAKTAAEIAKAKSHLDPTRADVQWETGPDGTRHQVAKKVGPDPRDAKKQQEEAADEVRRDMVEPSRRAIADVERVGRQQLAPGFRGLRIGPNGEHYEGNPDTSGFGGAGAMLEEMRAIGSHVREHTQVTRQVAESLPALHTDLYQRTLRPGRNNER